MSFFCLKEQNTLKEYFESILYRSFNTGWANWPIFNYNLKYINNKDILTGELKVFAIGKKTGDEVNLLNEKFEGLKDKEDIDNWVSENLSIMLMNHILWPK